MKLTSTPRLGRTAASLGLVLAATLAAPADELRDLISTGGLGRGFEPGAPSPTPEAVS